MTAMPPSAVPWAPEDLPISFDEPSAGFGYVVVEEIVDQIALLRRWPWPVVDPLGRLLWPEGSEHDTGSATVELSVLRGQLYLPNGLERPPRCGDTFAVAGPPGNGWRRGRAVRDLRELLATPVYDISADAREAAKIAYQASLAPIRAATAEDDEVQAQQSATLRERSVRPLPALTVAPPPERPSR
jgi:hypothetical protein